MEKNPEEGRRRRSGRKYVCGGGWDGWFGMVWDWYGIGMGWLVRSKKIWLVCPGPGGSVVSRVESRREL